MAQTDINIVVEAVDQASQTLNKVKQSMGGIDGVADNVGGAVDNLSNRFERFGKVSSTEVALAGTAITGGLIAGISSAVKEFATFESTMSGVRAVLNPTAEDFKKMNDLAMELGANTKYSATQSGEMMEMLAKNGLTATQILDGAAAASLDLAAATGAQLPQAADIASSALLVFNKDLSELEQVVNSITGTTNVSKFGIEDYALAMAQGGGAASAFGVSLEDFNASIAAISPLFQSGSDAGTSFKTFLTSLSPSTKAATAAMKNLGIITADGSNRFFDAQGNMKSMAEISGILQEATKDLSDEQKINYLQTIFGTDAMRAAAGMSKYTAEEFTKLQQAIEGTDAAENARIRMDNLNGAIEEMNGSIQTAKILFGQALEPAIMVGARAINMLADGFTKLILWINNLPAPIGNAIKIFGGLSIAVIGITAVVAVLVATMGGVASAFAGILAAAAPFIGIAVAIGAALYALYLAFENNFLGIRDITMTMFGWLKDYVTGILNLIKNTWATHGEDILKRVSSLWETVKGIFTNSLGEINKSVTTIFGGIQQFFNEHKETITKIWEVFWEHMKMKAQIALDLVANLIKSSLTLIEGVIKLFTGVVTGDWSKAWEGIKTIAKAVWDFIYNTIYSVGSRITQFIQSTFGIDVVASVSAGWNKVKSTTSDIWNGVKGVIEGIVNTIKNLLQGMVDKYNGAKAIVTAPIKFAGNVVEGAKTMAGNAWNGTKSAVSSAGTAVSNAASSAWNSATSIFRRANGGSVEAGRTYIVNERGGNEYFIPGRSGTIVPEHRLGGQTPSININFGGVTITNEADENRLVEKIKDTLSRELRTARLGIT